MDTIAVESSAVCMNGKEKTLHENGDSLVENKDAVSNICKSQYDVHNILTEEMIEEERQLEQKVILEEQEMRKKLADEEKKIAEEKCFKRLHLLLSRSSIYAKFMAEKLEKHELMQKKKEEREQKHLKLIQSKECFASSNDNEKNTSKRKVTTSAQPSAKKAKLNVEVMDVFKKENMKNLTFPEPQNCDFSEDIQNNLNGSSIMSNQPSLFYGGEMRPYQLEGYEWLKILYENGVNGILADEMGLGKTIQCIAFIAYLIEMGVSGPFLVCGPLSTLPNWYSEFRRFTPDIPVMLYHGHKNDRHNLLSKIKKKVKFNNFSCYPVIITSYQIALIDEKKLSRYEFKMLVIDEAHRIKNYECRLIKALKRYNASHRLLLTGTPLQNNLAELWSLLNFILPEIFDDLQVFQSWFDISRLSQNGATQEIIAQEQERQIISTIHQILTPFLLRRTKSDVELDLPPKKEVVVHAPLTKLQKKYYSGVLNKSIIKILRIKTTFDSEECILSKRKSKKTQYFGCEYDDPDNVSNGRSGVQIESNPADYDSDNEEAFSQHHLRLQNIMMCLRRICCHPYLISCPTKPIDEDIVKVSGKLLVLDTMLPELKKRGHKVIIFSQFTCMLDILEDYCEFRGYNCTILDGRMTLNERNDNLETFKDESVFIFLISTKAGGLGLNIISADTVIIYDSDWNPQGDLQAQDRCHRIGQTKPVVVYRLIVPNTIDEKILDYATAKRKLEKAIIQKGRFKSKNISRLQKAVTPEELLELLESSDNCGFVKTDDNNVLSSEELEKLLDRSDMK